MIIVPEIKTILSYTNLIRLQIYDLPIPAYMHKSIEELGLGSYDNIATVRTLGNHDNYGICNVFTHIIL